MSIETPSAEIFSRCLLDIEGSDEEVRIRGVQQLTSIPDSRSLSVAEGLLGDENPEVKSAAQTVIKRLLQMGIKPRMVLERKPIPQTYVLQTAWEAIDETLTIINRGLGHIIPATLICGSGKLLLVLFLLFADETTLSGQLYNWRPDQMLTLLSLVLLHLLFFRPFTWEIVGRAFLQSWPERRFRNQRPTSLSLGGYLQLCLRNLLPSLILFLPLVGMAAMLQSYNPELGMGILLFLLSVLLTIDFPRQPTLILHRYSSDSAVGRWFELLRDHHSTIRKNFLRFLLFLGMLYVAFAFSVTWIGMFFMPVYGTRLLLAGVITADILLDPIWIGFHLLIVGLLRKQA